jgi:putative tryptophan/tyrosine transport system substrate-binding protein
MKRREFIAGLCGAVAWPVVARAQQGARVRRIGVLLPAAADDTQFQAYVGAFLQGLALSGWTIGRNVRIDTRWATANAAEIRRHAAELAASAPDVILAQGNESRLTRLWLQRAENVQQVLRVPGGALAAALD